MQKQIIKVSNVRFHNGAVGSIKFVAGARGVVKCIARGEAKNLPMIRVGKHLDTALFEAGVVSATGTTTFCTARTPAKAFRKAVKQYWA